MKKRAFVTGATGAVGMALVKELLKSGYSVTVFANPGSERNKRLSVFDDFPEFQMIPLSLDRLNTFSVQELQRPDENGVFFHLGWVGTTGEQRNDHALQQKNVEYTADAVRLAHRLGCDAFVGTGSQAEYGPCTVPLRPDTPTAPVLEYGKAKLEAGKTVLALCDELGMRGIWTRILSVYGPYDTEKSMVMYAITSLLKGERPKFTSGEQMWDYLFSEDAASALVLAGEKGRNGAIYCLGSGRARPLKEYICEIRDCINPDLMVGIGEVVLTDPEMKNKAAVTYLCADLTELTEDTGFVPGTSFVTGIKKTVDRLVQGVKNEENQYIDSLL